MPLSGVRDLPALALPGLRSCRGPHACHPRGPGLLGGLGAAATVVPVLRWGCWECLHAGVCLSCYLGGKDVSPPGLPSPAQLWVVESAQLVRGNSANFGLGPTILFFSLLSHSFTHAFIYSLIYSLIHAFAHSFTCTFVYAFIRYSSIHAFIVWQDWRAAMSQTHGPRHPFLRLSHPSM